MTTEKIIEDFNTLYKYQYFLPKSNKEEFVHDLNKIIQNIQQNGYNYLTNKDIELFNTYDIETYEQEEDEETFIHLDPALNEEIEANLAQRIMQKIQFDSILLNEKIEYTEIKNIEFSSDIKAPEIIEKRNTGPLFIKESNFSKEKTLYSITKILVPYITNKGRKLIESKMVSERILFILKLIDDKSSITDLYNLYSYNYDNLLEFLDIIYELEKFKLITFIKTENINNKSGWIKIGQLLFESNTVPEVNINNALNYKKSNTEMLIGEALLELRFVNTEIFEVALKLQGWFSELIEKSIFISGIIKTGDSITNSESVSNVFDFIVPSFTPQAKENISKSNNTNLSLLNNILDGKSSLLSVFEKNKNDFNNDKLAFFKLIQKLESEYLLLFTKNENVKERSTQIRFGELLISLGIVNEKQIEDTFLYRQNNPDKKKYIGETLVELKYLNENTLENCLEIQKLFNNILSKISYENAFINAIKDILEDYFKLSVNIGKFIKKAFTKPLANMICITYTFSGELNGQIYYIFDRNFVEKLTKKIMASYGMDTVEIDESAVSEVCNMITGKTLTMLSKQCIFCEASMPEIIIDTEIIIANKEPILILPINSEYGRFIIGFNLTS